MKLHLYFEQIQNPRGKGMEVSTLFLEKVGLDGVAVCLCAVFGM